MIDSAAVLATSRARLIAVPAVAVAVAAGAGALDAGASTPPPSTTVPLAPGGLLAVPGGGFEVRFSAAPVVLTDPDGTSRSYILGVEEDTETLSVLAPTAFGAAAGTGAADRVLLFLDASGDEIEVLANTQTRLGPYPAAYFISRITLGDGKRAVLYGAAVVRANDVSYVFYTDVGGDDADRGRAFVESYAVTIDPYPAPTTTTSPTTTLPTAATATTATTDHHHHHLAAADDGRSRRCRGVVRWTLAGSIPRRRRHLVTSVVGRWVRLCRLRRRRR